MQTVWVQTCKEIISAQSLDESHNKGKVEMPHLQNDCNGGHYMKENEKKKLKRYKNLTRELRKLWNINFVPVIGGALGAVPIILESKLNKVDIWKSIGTIYTLAVLESTKKLRK